MYSSADWQTRALCLENSFDLLNTPTLPWHCWAANDKSGTGEEIGRKEFNMPWKKIEGNTRHRADCDTRQCQSGRSETAATEEPSSPALQVGEQSLVSSGSVGMPPLRDDDCCIKRKQKCELGTFSWQLWDGKFSNNCSLKLKTYSALQEAKSEFSGSCACQDQRG
jgi:hypothetical protein